MVTDNTLALRLASRCGTPCCLCAENLPEAPRESFSALDREAMRGRPVLLLRADGVSPELRCEALARAREAGATRVGFQGNGSVFRGSSAAELRALGLEGLRLRLWGGAADVHDYHAQAEGSFRDAVDAARAAKRAGLQVLVETVVTRSNFRSLAALARLLPTLGVAGWRLSLLSAAPRATWDRLVPRAALAMPSLLQAAEVARTAGVHSVFGEAPWCLAGPHARWALPREEAVNSLEEPCRGCALKERCGGLGEGYAARFGTGELRAREALLGDPSETPARWLMPTVVSCFDGASSAVEKQEGRRRLPLAAH